MPLSGVWSSRTLVWPTLIWVEKESVQLANHWSVIDSSFCLLMYQLDGSVICGVTESLSSRN